MKIGLYNPYLTHILGGGERHFLTIAECLSQKHRVDIILPSNLKASPKSFKKTFNLNLDKVNFISGPFSPQDSWIKRLNFTKQYDIFYYMTDGSFFIPKAKKNIVHFQLPFTAKPSLLQKIKLSFWQIKTANSAFTKDYLTKRWGIKFNYIHRGAIDTKNLVSGEKKNLIISVGRFISPDNHKHCKRQDFLVETFKKLCNQGLKNWQLYLVGPVDKGEDNLNFSQKVKQLAKNYPIVIKHNLDFNQLKKLYSQAKIYWHAAGFGIDQALDPQAVEHLGLTTAEAQSAGAVPIVINQGGQPEVVTHNLNGLLWQTQAELISQTLDLINHPKKLTTLANQANLNSKKFSKAGFCKLTQQIFSL